MMILRLERFSTGPESTVGILFVDKLFACFVCEDQHQKGPKVPAETRIPEGTYDLKLKTHGGFHNRYATRFSEFHQGMLWLQDVPGFTDILIHVGNTDDDSAGCLLVGAGVRMWPEGGGKVISSTNAYTALYPKVANELMRPGGKAVVQVVDRDR